MLKKSKTFVFCASSVLAGMFIALAACGDDVTKVTEVTNPGLEVVASSDSLGKCTAERSGEMKFAQKENAVYVCADSAWKNVSAAEKASCSAEPFKDSSGYKIVCGGNSVGVIFNGKDGKKGEAGKTGTSCTVVESPSLDSDFGSGYFVVCGSDTVGRLVSGRNGDGCTLTDNGDGSVSQVCGADTVNLYKAFCGGTAYDPDSSFCYEDSVVALCGGKSYDLSESFCYTDSVVTLCNGDRFDSEEQFCYENALYEKCAGETYDPQDSVCHNERLFGFFGDARDGQVYRTVKIGMQTWMAENLNYAYLQKTETEDSSSFCYNDSAEYCEKYGRLYIWSAAMDTLTTGCGYGKTCSPADTVRGICPDGWHLPSDAEWNALKKFVANTLFGGKADSAGYALKSASGWAEYNGKTGGSDAFGFGALPAGRRYGYGKFVGVLENAYFWSATEYAANYAYNRHSTCSVTDLDAYGSSKVGAMSVRCVKD